MLIKSVYSNVFYSKYTIWSMQYDVGHIKTAKLQIVKLQRVFVALEEMPKEAWEDDLTGCGRGFKRFRSELDNRIC